MSSSTLINGVNGQLEDWSQVNWKKARKVVRNLRQRIFRARKLGQWKQLRRLQKLLIRSLSNLLLSVRQITQVNTGKQTAGIDKKEIQPNRNRYTSRWCHKPVTSKYRVARVRSTHKTNQPKARHYSVRR